MKAHGPTHQHTPESIFEYLPGPVKVKDGLFFGDEIAARVTQLSFRTSNLSSVTK